MARQIDTSSLQGFKTLRDVNTQNALNDQKVAAGNVANASAANIYATQQLSAAAASGDQNLYTQKKQQLAAMGADMSGWADDIATGQKQAEAARLAQSPIGALLNAGLKAESNGISAAGTMGSVGGGAAITPLSQTLMGGLGGILPGMGGAAAVPRQRPAQILAAPQPPALPAAMPGQDPEAEFQQRLQEAQAQNGVSKAQDPALAAKSPGAAAQTKFVQPPQNSGETNQAYIQRVNQAFEQWKANPETIKAVKTAETAGTKAGELPIEAVNSDEITQRLKQNIQKLLAINDETPDSAVMSPDTKAYFSKRFGGGQGAGKLAEWNQIDQQQILSDYGQLVKSGAIKGSRQIFQALQTGSGIPADEPRAARKDLLNNLLAEITNKNITTQNVNAQVNGGSVQPYQAIPNNSQAPSASDAAQVYINLKNKGYSDQEINDYMAAKGLK